MKRSYKVTVTVPVEHADRMRDVMNDLGIGNSQYYEYASFSTQGIGRFRPLRGAKPAIGKVGEMEEVEEERIESVLSGVSESQLEEIFEKLKEAHPYEEPPIEISELIFPK